MNIEKAKQDLREGKFVLIHDPSERENETDMVIAAEKVKPEDIGRMRRDGGGLICTAIHPQIANKVGLPYLREIYETAENKYQTLKEAKADDLPYDERSAFSISVNHRDTFTGITDRDRALTISKLGEMSSLDLEKISPEYFGERFRTPGHVPILRAAEGLLEERTGHTELSVILAEMARLAPAVVVCEMMDGETKKALSSEKARKYSEENDIVYLEGKEIKKAYFDKGMD